MITAAWRMNFISRKKAGLLLPPFLRVRVPNFGNGIRVLIGCLYQRTKCAPHQAC